MSKEFEEFANHCNEANKALTKAIVDLLKIKENSMVPSDLLTEEIWNLAAASKATLVVVLSDGTIRTYHPPYPYSDEDVEFLRQYPGALTCVTNFGGVRFNIPKEQQRENTIYAIGSLAKHLCEKGE